MNESCYVFIGKAVRNRIPRKKPAIDVKFVNDGQLAIF